MDIKEFQEKLHRFHASFPNEGIYEIFSRCKIAHAQPEHILYEFTVGEADADAENNLHIGCLMTLFDVLMISAAYGAGNSHQPGVTADLNITCLGTAKIGEKLIIECETVKKGSRLSFFEAKAYKKGNENDVIARATETFAITKNNIQSSKL